MQPDPRTYLWDALQAVDSISRFVQHRTYDDYDADELLRSGVERKFEIIGEALNQLSKADRDLAARIPDLRQIIGLRNVLIHGYALVDNSQVWTSIAQLHQLNDVLRALLDELDTAGGP